MIPLIVTGKDGSGFHLCVVEEGEVVDDATPQVRTLRDVRDLIYEECGDDFIPWDDNDNDCDYIFAYYEKDDATNNTREVRIDRHIEEQARACEYVSKNLSIISCGIPAVKILDMEDCWCYEIGR